ncbi:class II aldolase/adducin family protein [Halosquirtibacter laminarini]|uniref:Class II aldolase/adducin family protein n=1 Tax=Halosquirtibacter laminarini TaxID=3374600 RepID=A0AC61NP67_9BACT|nr:class II aldolase/adducin family protein [Prolixibacteraceae bacterium]
MRQLDVKMMHPRVQIIKVIHKIYRRGMTTTSGGNISIKDNNGDIWVTPSAIDKGNLKEEDVICVKKDGTIVGKHKPSSEFPFHKAIYEARKDIKSIIHAHPPALVSFSIIREIPNTKVTSLANKICGEIGYAPYALPGSEELGLIIAKQFVNCNTKAIIMENHGTVLGGSDLEDAYCRFETLEYTARTIINAKVIGTPTYLTDNQLNQLGSQSNIDIDLNNNISYSSKELFQRKEIVDIVHRSCEQELMISSYGTVSVRMENNDFLITPSNIARWNIETEDIVSVRNGKTELGKQPSHLVSLHQKIYELNPHINSIIMTKPPHLMAYSITGVKFDVRTIPESWIFLQDVPNLDYNTLLDNTIPERLDKSTPSLLVANESFIVTGDKLIQTFDRLEVAEFSAKSLIMAAPISKLVPINDQQILDLKAKFLD